MNASWPAAGSPEEAAAWQALVARTPALFRALSDERVPQTVVIVPSLSMDPGELAKIKEIGRAHV